MPTGKTRQHSGGARERIEPAALLAIAVAVGLVFLNVTATFAMLAAIQRSLGLDAATLAWVTSAYSLAIGSLVLSAGTIGDTIGRRRAGVAGMLTLAAGSALVWLGDSAATSIAGQAVMGAGAALVVPNTLSLIDELAPDAPARSLGVSVWSAASGVGTAAGPIVAGALLLAVRWNVVYAAVCLLALGAALLLRRSVPTGTTSPRKLDAGGLVLAAVSVTAVLAALIEGARYGFASAVTAAALVAGAAGVAAFILVERHTATPMLTLRLFGSARFDATLIAGAAGMFCRTGAGLLVLAVFQRQQGLSTLASAFGVLPLFAGFIAASAATGFATNRLGPRVAAISGAVTTVIGPLALLIVLGGTNPWLLPPVLLFSGAGLGLVVSTASILALQQAPAGLGGMASAALNLARQLGTVLAAAAVTLLTADTATASATRCGLLVIAAGGVLGAAASGVSARPARVTPTRGSCPR